MTQFPRWKSIVVLIALIFGLIFFLPNVFGTDPALQLASKNYQPLVEANRAEVEKYMREKTVVFRDSFLEKGRLTVRFDTFGQQVAARDALAPLQDKYLQALTTAPRTPQFMRAIGLHPMNLGLDLRGGLQLLYQVDVQGAVSGLLERLEQEIRRTLREQRIQYVDVQAGPGGEPSPANRDPNTVRIVLQKAGDLDAARLALGKANPDMTFDVDNDANAPTIVLRLTEPQIKERQDYAIDQNITTLRNRVNELGVSEPIVQRQGIDRVNVQLPGVQNSAEVTDILGKTATLEFRLVDTANSPQEAVQRGRPPLGSKLYYTEDKQPVLLKREVIVTGDQLTDAKSQIDQRDGPVVAVKLDGRAAQRMLVTTEQNLNKPMAVVYIEKVRRTVERDGKQVKVDVTEEKVINTATIRGVFSSNFQISGLQVQEARNLALLLRAGSLVTPVYLIEERAIGPSTGQDNINKGRKALIIGSLLLFATMAIYYRAFGWIANAVLAFNVVLLVALLDLLGATLTLPGIAGIVLIVAMAVDANILIYERIREELRNGNSPLNAIESGFSKAFSAILDSNVTAFIAGLVLFIFGTGPIKGFAITLIFGIMTTLFTAILGSRALIHLIYGHRRKVEHLSI